ncbi:MAG: J domain-containing protein [Planctomycetales bacterium]|nr:J domain-containing protein [Planctomycetales bacterium]
MEEDFYKILGVSRTASDKEIQKAYRALARKHHPDRVEEDQREAAKQKFQKIQEAYDVLSDPEKRKLYDQFGHDYRHAQQGGGDPFGGFRSGGAWQGGGPGGAEIDLGDLFGGGGGSFADFMAHMGGGRGSAGARGPRSGPRPGASIEAETTISFQTSIVGGPVQLSVARANGAERLTVTIPPGIEDGKKMRLKGQGHPSSSGGPAGDLLLTVRVAPHPHFRRLGDNLSITLPITLQEAALGAKIDLPTPGGTIALTVPAGSSSGRKLRLKGLGVHRKETHGDLIVELQIVLPKHLDAEAEELVKQLQGRFQQGDVRESIGW